MKSFPCADCVRVSRARDRGDATPTFDDAIPDIMLVSIDTLRADHPGAYRYGKPTSAFIDFVAGRGADFQDMFVPVPAAEPSHAAMLTGLHPLTTGLLSKAKVLRSEFQTLAEGLRANGPWRLLTFDAKALNFIAWKGLPEPIPLARARAPGSASAARRTAAGVIADCLSRRLCTA